MATIARPRSVQKIPRVRRASNFAQLLVRYLAGQIAETHWQQILAGLDAAELDPHERTALVTFYLEATGDGEEIDLPLAEELSELLEIARG
jgi:hypothetical protein